MTPEVSENTAPTSKIPAPRGMHLLKTSLLIAGSAMLGGLAVVLWNQKTLATLRQPPEPTAQPSEDTNADEA